MLTATDLAAVQGGVRTSRKTSTWKTNAWICAAIVAAAGAFGSTGTALATAAAPTCDRIVAVGGSDRAAGSLEHPFATVQHLAESLAAGQTGCVRGGVYSEDVTIEQSGAAGAPITISSYPGERATLIGRLWVHQGANYVTVENLNLNGRNSASLPSPTVNGNNDQFLGNDVTDEHTEICFVVGSTWGRADHTLIQGNRIHDCGMIPSRNQDHGIYVDEADNTQILDNVIYKNTDRGIQLYPDAQGTVIEHNIIDSNGEGILFGGSSGNASSNTVVQDNLITNATIRYDVENWYPAGNPTGQNNTVQSNCVWGGAYGTIQTGASGFQATNNITANPGYANPTQGDYRVASGSPCAQLLAGNSIPTQPFTTTSTTTSTPEGGSGGSGESSQPPSESPPTPSKGSSPPSESTTPTESPPPAPGKGSSPPTESAPPSSGGQTGSTQESGSGAPTSGGSSESAPSGSGGGGQSGSGGHHHGGGHHSKRSGHASVAHRPNPKAHLAHRRHASIARRAKRH